MTISIPQPLSLPRPQPGSNTVTNFTIQPLPLAAILDHHLRRPEHQDRVFGTLLGLRNIETGEVEVRIHFSFFLRFQVENLLTRDSIVCRSEVALVYRMLPMVETWL